MAVPKFLLHAGEGIRCPLLLTKYLLRMALRGASKRRRRSIQEYLFESPSHPWNQDDVLIRPEQKSMTETSATRTAALWVGVYICLGLRSCGACYVFAIRLSAAPLN